MKKKSLILSLIFPVITTLLCSAFMVILFIMDAPFVGLFTWWWITCAAGILLGGVLPIVLTVITKTDTSGVLKKRGIILAATAAFYVAAYFIIGLINVTSDVSIAVIVIVPVIMSAVYHIRKADKQHLKWIIICLSDPILYFDAWYICLLLMINGVYIR